MRTTIVKSGFVILAPLFWLPGLAQATTGYIDVRDAATNADLGFVASAWNSFGEYGAITNSLSNSLLVSFSGSSPFSINFVSTPEPSCAALISIGVGLFAIIRAQSGSFCRTAHFEQALVSDDK